VRVDSGRDLVPRTLTLGAVLLLAVVLLLLAGACSTSGQAPSSDASTLEAASAANSRGDSHDDGRLADAMVSDDDTQGDGDGDAFQCADASMGFLGTLGCPCFQMGKMGCAGSVSTQSLLCSDDGAGLIWQANGVCAQSEVCNPTATFGSAGTCVPIGAVCQPANIQCSGSAFDQPQVCDSAGQWVNQGGPCRCGCLGAFGELCESCEDAASP
jgi:hypothetical protein